MKNITLILIVAIAFLTTISGCKKEKTPKTIYGKWEVTENNLVPNEVKYIIIGDDKTLSNLLEDELGFRTSLTIISLITDDQIGLGFYLGGSIANNYVLNEDILTIKGLDDKKLVLRRNSNAPDKDSWVKRVDIIAEGPLPWNSYSARDIAYNGSHILYGGYSTPPYKVGYINPNTFNLDDERSTTRNAGSVAVEKSSSPSRLIFQTNSFKFYGYTEDTNIETFESNTFTGPYVKAMTSLDGDNLWLLDEDFNLLLYKYTGVQEILKTINLGKSFNGMTYQNGYLYLCNNDYIYKCETNPEFKAVESFKLNDERDAGMRGIAFDGSNFWLNINVDVVGNKLAKIDLTL